MIVSNNDVLTQAGTRSINLSPEDVLRCATSFLKRDIKEWPLIGRSLMQVRYSHQCMTREDLLNREGDIDRKDSITSAPTQHVGADFICNHNMYRSCMPLKFTILQSRPRRSLNIHLTMARSPLSPLSLETEEYQKQLYVEEPFHMLLLHHTPCNVNSTALFTLHNTCKRPGTTCTP